MRKPAFRICEKGAEQISCAVSRQLISTFVFATLIVCMITLLPESEISSLQKSSVVVQSGLCQTMSETPKTGFFS